MNHRTPARAAFIAGLLLTGALAQSQSQSQSWEYRSMQKDPMTGQYSKDRFRASTITLEEKDGKAVFRMISGAKGDPCFSRGDLPAEVQRDAQTTTITVLPPLAGCQPFRFVIRNDGSGGVRQNPRGERWVDDGNERGLTPVK